MRVISAAYMGISGATLMVWLAHANAEYCYTEESCIHIIYKCGVLLLLSVRSLKFNQEQEETLFHHYEGVFFVFFFFGFSFRYS